MRRLLLVDDEPQLVHALKKALRPWREAWAVDVAEGGKNAIEALKSQPFDAVVSDARMPEVDGEAVLDFARLQQPRTVRLVLSGQVDAKKGHRLAVVAHQFLSKPSSGAAVLAAVEECCRLTETLADVRVRELVTSLGALPVGPKVYHRISELIDSPTASAEAVAEVIEEDLSLTTSLLRLVSSAFFGLHRDVTGIKEAVSIIGMERVRELVLMSEVFSVSDSLGLVAQLQKRGLMRARLARLIADGSPMTNLAGEAALLSEIGIYVLSLRRPDFYAPVWRRFQAGEAPLSELERQAFGCTHAQVGAALLGLWGIPQTVVNAVSWHHDMPAEAAELDTRTVLALTTALEEEAFAGVELLAPVDHLAAQLNVTARLPTLRDFAQQHFRIGVAS
jgi:HD-like signal output (HDOD) protein